MKWTKEQLERIEKFILGDDMDFYEEYTLCQGDGLFVCTWRTGYRLGSQVFLSAGSNSQSGVSDGYSGQIAE